MRYYLSAGRSRSWGEYTQAQVKDLILAHDNQTKFVTSGKSDFIVVPKADVQPSEAALRSEGQLVVLSNLLSKSNAPKPNAPKPSAPKPSAAKPSAPKPSAPKPSAPKPIAPKPSAPKPSAPKPSAPKPSAPKPSATKPSASKPSKKSTPVKTAKPKKPDVYELMLQSPVWRRPKIRVQIYTGVRRRSEGQRFTYGRSKEGFESRVQIESNRVEFVDSDPDIVVMPDATNDVIRDEAKEIADQNNALVMGGFTLLYKLNHPDWIGENAVKHSNAARKILWIEDAKMEQEGSAR